VDQGKARQRTLADIINDRDCGEPTESDIEKRKVRVQKMLAGKKKKKKGNDGKEFLEDKLSSTIKLGPATKNADESIADMIFHRKHSPSTGQ